MIEVTLEPQNPSLSGIAGGIPAIRLKIYSRARTEPSYAGQAVNERLMDVVPRLTISGVRIMTVELKNPGTYGATAGDLPNREAIWNIQFPRWLADAVESIRSGDVVVSLAVEYRFRTDEKPPFGPYISVYANCQDKVTERDWLNLLEQVGYRGGWVVEVPRPSIDGLERAVGFLESALRKIETRDPAGAVSDLWKAWDVADPILDTGATERDRAIDGLSRGDPGRPSKSQWISEIRNGIDNLCQIGPHSDVYEVTAEGALLAYRLTISMIAYLSRKSQGIASRNA
jgi:hypothetical protein